MANKDYHTSHTLFSTFREEGSHGVGAPHIEQRDDTLPRHKGKRLAMQPPLSGRNPEVLFDRRVRSLADGDTYLDPAGVAREMHAMLGGKQLNEKAFFPPKSTKKSVYVIKQRGARLMLCSACPGDTSVCMGPAGLLGSDWQNRPPKELGPSVKGKKNLYTNPGRKGGMGTATSERTIGRTTFAYMPDDYQHGRMLGKELRRKARERIAKPFNSAPNCGSGLFGGRDTFLSSTSGPAHELSKAKVKPAKSFVPTNPGKMGAAYCTLSNVGREYVPQPVGVKQKKSDTEQSTKPFKPCGGVKDRLSMWAPNPYQYDARPPPDLDFTLFD